jgi:hypothetical protein
VTARPEQAEKYAAERAALIEEVEFLLNSGESPASIPRRLGYDNPRSLERRLQRAGRNDLAAIVRPKFDEARRERHRQRNADKRVPCRAGCGGQCGHWSRYQICHRCMSRLGLARALGVAGSLEGAMSIGVRSRPRQEAS